MTTGKEVMIVTGEASGDMHGANLIKAMKGILPDLSVSGMGGKALVSQGMEPLYDAAKLSVVGLSEVFGHLGDIWAARRILIQHLTEKRPALLILIDLPDFNLMLAAKAKALGIPVFYYISPQVWAWRSGRVDKIKKLVDRMAVILPFEKDFYRQRGVEVDFVGHPLLDELDATASREKFLTDLGISAGSKRIVGILPGSRKKEISSMLPIFIEAAKLMEKKLGRLLFLLPVAPGLQDKDLAGYGLEDCGLDIRLIRERRFDLMANCDAVVAASGTVTLELGLLNVPMVVSYRVSPLSYFLGRRFIKVEHASLVNLIAERQVVRELLQADATPENISQEVIKILTEEEYCQEMKKGLNEVARRLGEPGASLRAAELALAVAGLN
jgi:lipid-A-disaccharide synthase